MAHSAEVMHLPVLSDDDHRRPENVLYEIVLPPDFTLDPGVYYRLKSGGELNLPAPPLTVNSFEGFDDADDHVSDSDDEWPQCLQAASPESVGIGHHHQSHAEGSMMGIEEDDDRDVGQLCIVEDVSEQPPTAETEFRILPLEQQPPPPPHHHHQLPTVYVHWLPTTGSAAPVFESVGQFAPSTSSPAAADGGSQYLDEITAAVMSIEPSSSSTYGYYSASRSQLLMDGQQQNSTAVGHGQSCAIDAFFGSDYNPEADPELCSVLGTLSFMDDIYTLEPYEPSGGVVVATMAAAGTAVMAPGHHGVIDPLGGDGGPGRINWDELAEEMNVGSTATIITTTAN